MFEINYLSPFQNICSNKELNILEKKILFQLQQFELKKIYFINNLIINTNIGIVNNLFGYSIYKIIFFLLKDINNINNKYKYKNLLIIPKIQLQPIKKFIKFFI